MLKLKSKIKNIKIQLINLATDIRSENKKIILEPNKIKRRLFLIIKIIKSPKRIYNILTGKTIDIPYVEIVLTTYCTLRCKGCSALMNQYTDREHIDLSINIESIQKLLDSVDSISHIRMLGGEPLCYPYLFELLKFIDKQNKIKKATIVTNGTLLLTDDRIITILKKDKFNVYISDYGKNSTKKEELVEQLIQNKIKYYVRSEDYLWHDYGDLICRNRKERELQKQFLKCDLMCKSLLNGKLFHCPRNSHGVNIEKIPLREQDYIDLLDNKISKNQLRKKIYDFYFGYVPYTEACNYCNYKTKQIRYIKSGVQCENSK